MRNVVANYIIWVHFKEAYVLDHSTVKLL